MNGLMVKKLPRDFKFSKGAHAKASDGMCVMEAVAYVRGLPHSDHPPCVSPVIAQFARSWNDALSEPPRTKLLKPLIPLMIGTATNAADEQTRAWLATDWLVRVQAPVWLHLAGLTERAEELRNLPQLTNAEIATACQSALNRARTDAAAARDAARDAAWAAAWDAAAAAAADAAGAAARDAAGAAAGAAARAAAWAAAGAAAGAAAWAAAWDAARAAARDAARKKLAPSVEVLQASAVDLLTKMCNVGRNK
jgi:hypothetical protein